jgi:hypothetical protein
MKWFIFFFLLNTQVRAESEKEAIQDIYRGMSEKSRRLQREPMLSERYRQGAFFIYDCEDHHFACVNIDNFQECKNRRQQRLETRQVNLSCAPMKEFESFEDCRDYQISAVNRLLNKDFCFQDTGETLLVF